MPTTPAAVDQTLQTGGSPRRRVGAWTIYALGLLAVLVCVGGAIWLRTELRQPTAFTDFGYGGGVDVRAGTTATFPLTPDPWDGDHGTLHVRSVTPLHIEDGTGSATLVVWRCSRTTIGAPGGYLMGERPIGRICADPQRVSGPFDYDASRGSREALLLAVTSQSTGVVRFSGVDIDYREGLHSGHQVIGVDGRVTYRAR